MHAWAESGFVGFWWDTAYIFIFWFTVCTAEIVCNQNWIFIYPNGLDSVPSGERSLIFRLKYILFSALNCTKLLCLGCIGSILEIVNWNKAARCLTVHFHSLTWSLTVCFPSLTPEAWLRLFLPSPEVRLSPFPSLAWSSIFPFTSADLKPDCPFPFPRLIVHFPLKGQ